MNRDSRPPDNLRARVIITCPNDRSLRAGVSICFDSCWCKRGVDEHAKRTGNWKLRTRADITVDDPSDPTSD